MIFSNKINFDNPRLWNFGAISLLLLYLAPLLIFRGELNFLVFDNLDSNVVWFKVLAQSGKMFAENDVIIPNIMGGLPRSSYGSEFNILLWFYYFFTPLQAYILNEVLMHSIAFISMYIFLDRYLFKNDLEQKYIYVNIGALFFALLPFWPSGGLSVPLMPLVTYFLLQIEEGKANWKAWLLLLLLPLYSGFVLVYFFYLLLAALYFIRQTIIKKTFNKPLFLVLVLMVILFLLKDYRLVLQMFLDNGFISNRSEYFSLGGDSFIDSYRSALLAFLDGVPHARGIHRDIILPGAFLALILSLFHEKLSLRNSIILIILFSSTYVFGVWQVVLRQIYTLPLLTLLMLAFMFQKKDSLLPTLIFFQIILSFWLGFAFYEGWNIVFEFIPALKMFNFSRFIFVSQMLWAIIAAVSIKILLNKIYFSKLLIIVFVASLLYISITSSFFNLSKQLYHLPFNKYYASKQFNEIKEFIGEPQKNYRVISLGIEPSISQYNGFYTLDGYMVNYPLTYKHKFRKIIRECILKDNIVYNLFDGWGSKVYLFTSNVMFTYANQDSIKYTQPYRNLDFNTTQISKMGGKYLISANQIEDPEKYKLKYLHTFNNEDSLWTIFLYKVNIDE